MAFAESLLPHEQPPHPYRCSGFELQQDAAKAGLWRPQRLVLAGEWEPEIGDVLILQRGSGWQRHVCRLAEHRTSPWFATIGGNENDRWKLTPRQHTDQDILGWIEYPRPEPGDMSDYTAARLLALSRAAMAGEGDDLAAVLAAVDSAERRELA